MLTSQSTEDGDSGRRSGVRDNSARARVLAAAVVATIGASLPMFLVSALAVEMPALDGSPGRAGAAVAIFSVTTAVLGLPFGRVVARSGWATVLRAGAVASSASIATMVGTASHLPALLLTVAAAGASFAAVVPATNAALQEVTAGSAHRGLAYGVKQASAPAAIALAGLGLGALVASALGWRGTLLVMASVPLLGAVGVPRGGVGGASRVARDRRTDDAGPGRELLLLGLAAFLGTSAAVATVTLLPITLLAAGTSPGTTGAIVAGAGLASLVGRIAAGAVSDRTGRDPLTLMAGLLCLGAVGHLLLASGAPLAAAIGAPISLGLGWGWPGLFHDHVSGLGVGAGPATGYSMIGLSLGGATGPLLIGGVMDVLGTAAGWSVAGGLAITAAGLTQVARRGGGSRRP